MKSAMLVSVAAALMVGGAAARAALVHENEATLTPEVLASTSAVNLYEALGSLRSRWLDPQPGTAAPAVYIEMPCNVITCLRWVDLEQVEQVRLLGPESASALLRETTGNAIVVTLATREVAITTTGGDR